MKLKNRSSFRIISSSTTLHQMQTRAAATPIETLGVIPGLKIDTSSLKQEAEITKKANTTLKLNKQKQKYKFLKIDHHIHSSYEKSIIVERTMQYIIKDRTESFDDYFPCKKKNKCK